MPERAIVFVADYSDSLIKTCKDWLPKNGHTVVDTATEAPEALEKIRRLGRIDVAIVGSLRGGSSAEVVQALRRQNRKTIVVGVIFEDKIPGVDVNLRRDKIDSAHLPDFVSGLKFNP